MQRLLIAVLLLAVVGGGAVLVYETLTEEEPQDFAANLISVDDIELPSTGFASVEGEYDWQFPADYAPHPDFQREQWQLATADNCAGQLNVVFERISLVPAAFVQESESSWRVNDVVLAQGFIEQGGETIVEAERAERQTLDLAGVSDERVFVDAWSLNFAENILQLRSKDGELTASFMLQDGQPQAATDEWYLYTRAGQITVESNLTGLDNFTCDITLTHRFGSSS
jgi:predicted secreted hydrolase